MKRLQKLQKRLTNTLVTNPTIQLSDSQKTKHKKILSDVKDVLNDENVIDNIMKKFDKNNENTNEYIVNREKRVKMVLNAAGYESEEDFELYIEALSSSSGGYSIILKRDIDEIFVNSYNAEWILAWNGNIDLQICLDFFAVITYITEYFTKDDTGTMETLLEALKNSESSSFKDRMILLMNTFLTHRQMGEAEAVYKVFPDFHFKDSNITTVFIPNCPFEERSKFLIQVDDKPEYSNIPTIKIENREGNYIEKYDIVSKYQRREGLESICAAQFTKMYEPSWKGPSKKETQKILLRDNKNKFHFVMMHEDEVEGEYLPNIVRLLNPYPNEPPFMRKRKTPAALRFHKVNENKDPKRYFFSECLLYVPFRTEEEIWQHLNGDIPLLEQKIRKVKSQVMEHLENNEEARLFVEETLKAQEVGDTLDPEGEQDRTECELEGQMLHPDFEHLNPDDLGIVDERKGNEKQFRPIEIDSVSELIKKTRKLDFFQRKIVEKGINHSRNLVKSLKDKNSLPEPFHTIVIGGAGSGKSTVINVLKQWMHLILRKEVTIQSSHM